MCKLLVYPLICGMIAVQTIYAASFFYHVKCPLEHVNTQEAWDIHKFRGTWYSIARFDQHGDNIMSAVSHYDVTQNGKVRMQYGGDLHGHCIEPMGAISDLPSYNDAKLTFSSDNSLRGTYWVVKTDYYNYALLYRCQQINVDGVCPKGQESVTILSRGPNMDIRLRTRLEYMIEHELCIDPEDLTLVSQKHVCPPHPQNWRMAADEPPAENSIDPKSESEDKDVKETPKEAVGDEATCLFGDIHVAENFDVEQVSGKWYILATWRESSDSARSGGVFDIVVRDDGNIDSYFTGAHDGVCLPTFYGLMSSTDVVGQYTIQNEQQNGPIKFTYFTSDHQYGVTYQCTGQNEDGSCVKSTIDVYGRTIDFPEEVRVELRTHVETMCVKPDQFQEISHEISCELHHEQDEHSCLVADVHAISNVDWEKQSGSWFTVASYKGRAAPSLTWLVVKDEAEDVFHNYMGYSRNMMCVKPEELPITLKQGDGHVEYGAGENERHGIIVYTDNKDLILYYECTRVLEDGTCDPEHTKININTRSRDTPKHVVRSLKVILADLCVDLADIEANSHEVPCEADPELFVANPEPVHPIEKEEEHVDGEDHHAEHETSPFESVASQDDFDAAKFTGVWYHVYRLKWSHHQYESEVNYVTLQDDGTIRALARYYHDGRCSPTESHIYTQAKEHKGDWSFGTYGGLKILHTCYNYAVLYICEHVERDGTCKHDNVEVEVLARTKNDLPEDEIIKITEVLENAGFSKDQFEKTDHKVVCELTKAGCDFETIPQQEDLNMDKLSGTWNLLANLKRDGDIESGALRIVKSDGGYTIYMKFRKHGSCQTKSVEFSLNEGTATLTSNDGPAVIKVMYTDYENTLLYLCRHVDEHNHCQPGGSVVYLLGRDSHINDRTLRTLVDVAFEACFTQSDFQRVTHTDTCKFDLPKCKIADLPKAEDLDVQKFVGKWYGLYRLRSNGDWQDGVMDYELRSNGNIKATGTSARDGICADARTFEIIPGATPYEWNEIIGSNIGYIRVLDSSKEGNDHIIIVYHCDHILDDGTCDPEQVYVEVMAREKKDFSEDTKTHLRTVIREACLEPGDFAKVFHEDVQCEVRKLPDIACDITTLPIVEDFSYRKFSGFWYVVAKLRGSYIPDSTVVRFHITDDGTFKISNVGYRARRGCMPTVETTGQMNGGQLEVVINGVKASMKITWTDYSVAMTHGCMNVDEDGSCVPGFERAMILSRHKGPLPENVIVALNSVSYQECARRWNFEYIKDEVDCELHIPRDESCKEKNIKMAENFDPKLVEGEWYGRFMSDPKRDGLSVTSLLVRYHFEEDGTAVAHGTFDMGGKCYYIDTHLYPGSTPNYFIARTGRNTMGFKFIFVSDKYLITYVCQHLEEDGFCSPGASVSWALSKSLDELPEDVLEKASGIAHGICMEPGDFVQLKHTREEYCPFPDPPEAHACKFDELPLQENCEIDRFTGTWYVAAKLKESLVRPSAEIRIEKHGDSYEVHYTGMSVFGKCHSSKKATIIPSDTGCIFSLDYKHFKGQLKVLYTDYWYAMVYECLQLEDDGTCAPGADAVTVFARNLEQDLSPETIDKMLKVAEKACYKKEDFELVDHKVKCNIEHEKTNLCKVRNIPVQDNLDIDRFSGVWYGHYKLPSEWDAVVHNYEKEENGDIRVYYSGEESGRCVRPYRVTMEPSPARPAVMTKALSDRFTVSRVVYTDYQYAVVYSCEQVLDDGNCKAGMSYLDVLSRSVEPISHGIANGKLKAAIRDTCHEPGDLVESPHQVLCESRPITCPISTMGEQKDLDMEKFSGTWNLILGLKNSELIDSGVWKIEKTETGFSSYVTHKRNGVCSTKHRDVTWEEGTAVLKFTDHGDSGLIKILYTDYDYGLVYICRKLHGDDACIPGYDLVYGISRTSTIDDSHLRSMVDASAETCFSQEHFDWIPEIGACEAHKRTCKIADMPKSETIDVSKIAGKWFGRYHLRGHGNWQDGVMQYDVLEDGRLKVTSTGSLDGQCLEAGVYILDPTENAYEFYLPMHSAHFRILDASDNGENHMILYECDSILDDGTCDPSREFMEVLTRHEEELTPEQLQHLRGVVRSACYEPGDFEEVIRHEGVACSLEHVDTPSCNFAALPNIEDFNSRKMSGMWYAVAKLKGSNLFTTTLANWHHADDNTVSAHFRLYSPRRGCLPTMHQMSTVEGSTYLSNEGKVKDKVIWTNYDVALIVECSSIQEDGSCAPGHLRGAVLSRQPGPIPEELIVAMNSVSDEACANRENYAYFTVDSSYCEPEVPKAESCKVANIVPSNNVNKDTMSGEWILRYALRSKFTDHVSWFHSKYDFKDNGEILLRWSAQEGETCHSGTGMLYPTQTTGQFKLRNGHTVVDFRVLFLGDNYLVAHSCGDEVLEDGYCDEDEASMIVMSRNHDPIPEDIIKEAESLIHNMCFEFGDFEEIIAEGEEPCPLPQEPHELKCDIGHLPLQENFVMERFTGTWYAVASLKGHPMGRSEKSRIYNNGHGYGMSTTNLTPRGTCHHAVIEHVHETDTPGLLEVEYGPKKTIIRVLYTDYEYAMIYDCLDVLDNGHCKAGADTIVVHARKPHLPDDAIQRMIPVVEEACYSREDFERVPRPVECDLRAKDPEACKLRDIHVQDHFNLDKFLGVWYSRYKVPDNWDTVVYEYAYNDEGELVVHTRGEVDGHCVDTKTLALKVSKGNNAVTYYLRDGGVLGESKVVYTDYNYAVIYTCGEVLEDGTCKKGSLFVNLMSRNLDEIPEEDVQKLRDIVRYTCYEPGDFVETVHKRHCAPHNEMGCKLSETPLLDDFDMDKFTGRWEVVGRLRNTGTIDSGVFGIASAGEGEYMAYVTGARDGKCIGTLQMKLHPGHKGNPADIHIQWGEKEGLMRVMYTDYNVALVYLCKHYHSDGLCHPGEMKVLALGRTDRITNGQLRAMGGAAKKACFTSDQFEWVNREVECKLDITLANRCKPANLPTAENVEVDGLLGTWYVRYTLRHATEYDSAMYRFELLSSGDVRFSATGAMSGTCVDRTGVSIAYHTDDAAVWHLRYNRVSEPDGFVKVLYLDSDYAVFYKCSKVNNEEFCDWDKVTVTVVSRSKNNEIPEEMIQKLMKIGRGACFEPGMFAAMPQEASCELATFQTYDCEGEMESVENFNMDKFTGTWYGIAKLKGSAVPNSRVVRFFANDDGTYTFRTRGERNGRCQETADHVLKLADDGLSELHLFNGDVKQAYLRVLYTDYEEAIVYSCTILQEDGTCAPGHENVGMYARTPEVAGDDIHAHMSAHGHTMCIGPEHYEPIPHHKECWFDNPIPEECLEANIKAMDDFSLQNFTGTWYTLFRLRDAGSMDFGKAELSLIDEHHLMGEFTFSVNGQCVSVDTMYHQTHAEEHTGKFYTNIGRFTATVKILATDYKYAVLYECENVDANGVCSHGGRFVGIFGRTTEYPPEDVRAKLRKITRDACLEPGDFVATHHTSECEFKVDKASVGCKLSELPVKNDHVYNKDTGTWYVVAKLRGSNFLSSHVERGVFDEEKQMYSFYFAGERARGGCTPTGRTDMPLQTIGEPAGIVTLTVGSHKGQWRVLYNDYKYALYYECSHTLDDDTCAPGYESVIAYSRKREHIPEDMIVKMFENIPEDCFTREDFEWVPQNTLCELEYDYPDCRVRQIPYVDHFNLDQIAGTWYSRFLLVAHAEFDSMGVRFERTENGLRGLYSAAKDGVCQRTMELDIEVPNHTRGIWHRIKDGKRVTTKVMWTDYNYLLIYTCDDVLEDDNCAPGKDYIDVLSRHLKPIPVVVIEELKIALKKGCYEPGDFVESDHILHCEERSCKVDGVVTPEDFTLSQILGKWELLGRTTHIQKERGPTTMHLMKGQDGTARISMARQHEFGCNTYQGAFTIEGSGTFKFTHNGEPGILKVLDVNDDLLMIYECYGAEPVDGYCPEENEEIQVWGRVHSDESPERFAKLREIASRTTCVDLQNSVHVKANTECEVPRSCRWKDFVGQEHFDPRSVLGEWSLLGRSTWHEPTYSTGGIKYGYIRGQDGAYSYAGTSVSTEECSSHPGTITYIEPTLYRFNTKDEVSEGRFLYVDGKRHILVECRGELEHGECPKDKTIVYIFKRTPEKSEEGKALVLKELKERTHDCFDLDELTAMTKNECEVPDTEGRQSCSVDSIDSLGKFKPSDFEGAWFLIARSGHIDLKWDAGVLSSTLLKEGVFQLKYTGLVSYDKDECLEVYTEEMHQVEGQVGEFDVVTNRLGGVESRTKILYADDDHFIYYGCQGNTLTSYGACEIESEHVEVFSRRRRINSVEKAKLAKIIKEKTCMQLDNFVMANHTKKCELPGITDKYDHGHKSCKVADIEAQHDFDPSKFAGLWYEIERTRYDRENNWESGVAHYTVHEGHSLEFSYAGTDSGECKGPFKGYGKPVGNDNADLVMNVGGKESYGSPWSVHFTYKVIYTDYNVALTFACAFWNDDGTCRHPGEQVDILSRTPDLDSETRSKLYDIIRERLCVDVYDLVEPAREDDCHVLVGAEVPVDCSGRPMCMIECEQGFVKGDDGCDTCKCVEQGVEVPVDCSGRPMCMIECEQGFVKGDDGCDTCKCVEQVEHSGDSGEDTDPPIEEVKHSGDGHSQEEHDVQSDEANQEADHSDHEGDHDENNGAESEEPHPDENKPKETEDDAGEVVEEAAKEAAEMVEEAANEVAEVVEEAANEVAEVAEEAANVIEEEAGAVKAVNEESVVESVLNWFN